jgi:3'(2'),5'-bisphosphate nucleotidase
VPAVETSGSIAARAERQRLAEAFAQLTLDAAVAIMGVYASDFCVRTKSDHSPVSEADELAEVIILEGLALCAPGIPVLAEESASKGFKPATGDRFILVDPVDGTREFIGRNGEFTVNIALIEHGVPVVGAVYAPVLKKLWAAADDAVVWDVDPGQTLAAARSARPVAVRTAPASLTAIASRSHGDAATEAFLARLPIGERRGAGSSLKFCLVAEGEADVYPRFGPTMEWDTAAGDAVLRAAGGTVMGLDDTPLGYGKTAIGYRNAGFIAWGDRRMIIPAQG